MPDEKLVEIVSEVDFGMVPDIWMPKLEKCFHQVLIYECYLNKIPDNLALPKYRKIVLRIVYRLFNQIHPSQFEFSRSILQPDHVIQEFMDYLVEAEIIRKQEILKKYPLTQQWIKSQLKRLKKELEI